MGTGGDGRRVVAKSWSATGESGGTAAVGVKGGPLEVSDSDQEARGSRSYCEGAAWSEITAPGRGPVSREAGRSSGGGVHGGEVEVGPWPECSSGLRVAGGSGLGRVVACWR